MQIVITPGVYVVAVSGGVDSMVLLDLLSRQAGTELVVTHFDHGIRKDSYLDRQLVQGAAEKYGLAFEYAEGRLGPGASEDTARISRYEFLHAIRRKHKAGAIVTAHHQDDLLETALLNLLRGTGRKGLTSLTSTAVIKRPLLEYSKKDILAYAKKRKLIWREDPTNLDTKYLRNFIRVNLVSKLTQEQRAGLLRQLNTMHAKNKKLDLEIANYLQLPDKGKDTIDRQRFIILPHTAACEAMAGWLRLNGIRGFDRKAIERLVVAAKTLRPGQRTNVSKGSYLTISKTHLAIQSLDR